MTKTVSVAGSTATTFEITGLSAGTYYFSVVAYNSMGVDSADSNVGTKTIS